MGTVSRTSGTSLPLLVAKAKEAKWQTLRFGYSRSSSWKDVQKVHIFQKSLLIHRSSPSINSLLHPTPAHQVIVWFFLLRRRISAIFASVWESLLHEGRFEILGGLKTANIRRLRPTPETFRDVPCDMSGLLCSSVHTLLVKK